MVLNFYVSKKPAVLEKNCRFYMANTLKEVQYEKNSDNIYTSCDIEDLDLNKYKKDFDELVEVLKIKDNMNYNFYNVVKYCLYHLMFDIKDIEPISQDEFQWINSNLYCDQIRYADFEAKFEGKNVKQYDINSMFPYCLSTGFDLPVSKMKFAKIDEIDMKKHRVFLCRLKVDNLPEHLYQNYNDKNYWFSRYDILIFNRFGCKYELIQDGKDNYAYYEKTQRIKHACILRLFEIKKQNCVANIVIKRIHGMAMSRPKEKIIDDNAELNEKTIIKNSYICEKLYSAKHPLFYRMKLVMYNCVKYMMSEHIKKIIDDGKKIYRIATDSITFDKDCHVLDNLLDVKMGKFKIEDKFEINKKYKYGNNLKLVEI